MTNTTSTVARNVSAALARAFDLERDIEAIAELLSTDCRAATTATQARRHLVGLYSFSFPQLSAVARCTGRTEWDLFEGTDCEDSPATRKRWANEQSLLASSLQRAREDAGLTRRELSFRSAVVAGEAKGNYADVDRIRHLEHSRTDGAYLIVEHLVNLSRFGAIGVSPERIKQAAQENELGRRLRERHDLQVEGQSLGRMIWNAAEDREFIDLVIANEMVSGSVNGPVALKLRAACAELADQLQIMFPGRPRIDGMLIE